MYFKMKKILFLLISILAINLSAKAQIDYRSPDYHFWNQLSIGKTDATATATNAWLEIGKYGTNKHMILPRFNRFNIIGQEGAFGYDINVKKLYFHDGVNWQQLYVKGSEFDSLIINAKYFPSLGVLRFYRINGDSTSYTTTQTLNLSGNNLSISGGNSVNFSTSNVSEGSNLYFTTQRVRQVFTFNNGLDYDQLSGVIKFGGNLSQATNLNLSGFNFNIVNATDNIIQFTPDKKTILGGDLVAKKIIADDTIIAKNNIKIAGGNPVDGYFLSTDNFGNGSWENILNIPITDLSSEPSIPIQPTDSLITALGKLQAQINGFNGNFIKNDSTNYQDAGFSVLQPSRISFTTDTTAYRPGALEVYRTTKNAPIPNRVIGNVRSVLRVSNTTIAASDSREMSSIYGGLHINSDNVRSYVNGTEGIIAVAGTASNFGSGDITLMSAFAGNTGSSPTATGIVKKFIFYKVTGHSLNGGTSKTAQLSGFAQPKLTAGFTSNINWLSGLGADTSGPAQLGLTTWPGGNWNIYDASTYKSFLSGNLMIGDTVENNFALRVAGKIKGTDTAYFSKIVGGVFNTDKITLRNYSGSLSPISVDSNGLSLGTTSGIIGTLLNISKTYTNPSVGVTSLRITPQVYDNVATHNAGLVGAVIQPIISGSNTQGWTIPVQGISIAPTISTGATGLINSVIGETVTQQFLSSSGATVDTFIYRRAYKSGNSVAPVNNEIFDLVGGASGIGGHWSRYDATTYNSYWGTGNQLIGTTTDNGFGEKIQVNGRINASRAIRGSNVVTKDQLDSLGATTILNQTATNQIASFRLAGTGKADSLYASTFRGNAFLTGSDSTGLLSAVTGVVQLRAYNKAVAILGASGKGYMGIQVFNPNSYFHLMGSLAITPRQFDTSIVLSDQYYSLYANNDTNIVYTLPQASTCTGRIYEIKKMKVNNALVIISPFNNTDSIDHRWRDTLSLAGESIKLQSYGNYWQVLSRYTTSNNYIQNQFNNKQSANAWFNKLRVDSIGIGKNPSVPLDVVGDALINGSLTTTGSVTAQGGGFNSLRSLKKDITPYEGNALKLVENLKIYNFKYKANNKDSFIGMVIDENKEVPKELLMNDGTAINTYNTISILIKSIQELNQKIELLEAQLKNK